MIDLALGLQRNIGILAGRPRQASKILQYFRALRHDIVRCSDPAKPVTEAFRAPC
jgi:hypothetical protein